MEEIEKELVLFLFNSNIGFGTEIPQFVWNCTHVCLHSTQSHRWFFWSCSCGWEPFVFVALYNHTVVLFCKTHLLTHYIFGWRSWFLRSGSNHLQCLLKANVFCLRANHVQTCLLQFVFYSAHLNKVWGKKHGLFWQCFCLLSQAIFAWESWVSSVELFHFHYSVGNCGFCLDWVNYFYSLVENHCFCLLYPNNFYNI